MEENWRFSSRHYHRASFLTPKDFDLDISHCHLQLPVKVSTLQQYSTYYSQNNLMICLLCFSCFIQLGTFDTLVTTGVAMLMHRFI